MNSNVTEKSLFFAKIFESSTSGKSSHNEKLKTNKPGKIPPFSVKMMTFSLISKIQ